MGIGKTLCALNVAFNNNSSLIIIKNALLVKNYMDSLKAMKPTNNLRITTYKNFKDMDEDVIVVYETHHLNNVDKSGVPIYITILRYIQQRPRTKIVLMAETPIINYGKDLIPILSLLMRWEVCNVHEFDFSLLRGKVTTKTLSIFNNSTELVYEDKLCDMDDYEDKANVSRNIHHGIQRHSLKNKYLTLLDEITKQSSRVIVYCENIKGEGLDKLGSFIDEHNVSSKGRSIKYLIFTGEDINDHKLLKFNSGKVDMPLASSAICEGVSLKNVRKLIIYTMFWNSQSYNQLIGRIKRLGSNDEVHMVKVVHALSVTQNVLHIPNYVSNINDTYRPYDDLKSVHPDRSIDLFKRNWCNKKDADIDIYLTKLRSVSIDLDDIDSLAESAGDDSTYKIHLYNKYLYDSMQPTNHSSTESTMRCCRWVAFDEYDVGEYIKNNIRSIGYIIHGCFKAQGLTHDAQLDTYIQDDKIIIDKLNEYISDKKLQCHKYSIIKYSIDGSVRIIISDLFDENNNKRRMSRGVLLDKAKKKDMVKAMRFYGFNYDANQSCKELTSIIKQKVKPIVI
ncbi:hypothetical protein K502DRAFT_361213 [Neoconidiobolus thromboides FSU 785]|nr:hypothetical protein K502DRAFT_361213 [Neoconidiobolus thromboides FSU 785]